MKLHFKFELRSLEDLIFFLIYTNENEMRIPNLIERCKRIGMMQIDYINFQNDPAFELGYSFLIGCDTEDHIRVEIIELNNITLQSGFQIIFNPHFLSLRFKKCLSISRNFLHNQYKNEFSQQVQNVSTYNYSNIKSQSSLSNFIIDSKKVLNFRVMNKLNWENVNYNSPIINN